MATPTVITDESNGNTVKLVMGNALAVGPSDPSKAFNAELAVDDTAINIVPAVADKLFCITGIILTGNKNISTSVDAVVTIYESDTATPAAGPIAPLVTIMTIPVARSGQIVLTGITLTTETGRYINGITTDDDVFVTILGYYLDPLL